MLATAATVHVFEAEQSGVVPVHAPISSGVHATQTRCAMSQIGFAASVQSAAIVQPCGALTSASTRQLSSGLPGQ